MKWLVTGGTGFIGAALRRALTERGDEALVLTRRPEACPNERGVRWLSWERDPWPREMASVDGLVNLAGEPVTARRWTARQKSLLRASRVQTTRRLVDALAAAAQRPAVLVNASGIGYYGPCDDEELDEAAPAGRGFLAQLCQEWEAEARRAESLGVRVVRLRIGLVLGPGGGALAKMAPPFRCFLGGPLGSGRQWMSWIHQEDVAGLIVWALTYRAVSGAVNATAPHPVTMTEFCAVLARALRRPSWARVPAFALRVLLGEMAEMLLTGQRAVPAVARRAGFTFQFPDLMPALAACTR